jgi:hypothetical protein
MAKSVLDLIIKLSKQGQADDETIKGLYRVKSAILDAAAVGGMFVAAGFAVKKILDETVGTLVQYADEVRRVQNATGASAEDSSKLIQILDDQKISYEQLEKAIQKSGKAYDFSIEGIANMSEAYGKLGNSQDKASFMQERFGKQWISFVPIMQQGKQAILDAAAAVDKNLVLQQKAVDGARMYEVSVDNLSDSFMGLKISIGQELLPVVNEFLDGMNVYIRAQQIMAENNTNQAHGNSAFKDALAQATIEIANQKVALTKHAEAMEADSETAKENAAAIKEVSAAHQSMLGLIGSIASETKSYSDKQAELTQKMAENRSEMEKLYPWQKQQIDELNQKYADMEGTYAQNAEAHNAAMMKIQFDLLQTKLGVDGLDDADMAMLQQAGVMFGVFDQKSVDSAKNFDLVSQAVKDGRIGLEDMKRALDLLPTLKNIDVVIRAITQMTTVQQNVTQSGSANYVQQLGVGGYAAGGIATGPDSGHMELLHGTEAVIPLEGGAVPVSLSGAQPGASNSNVYVSLTISSPITILDEQAANNTLLPFIVKGIREAKARGAI